jgi:hypothetical protein
MGHLHHKTVFMKKLFLLCSLGVLACDVNAQFNIPNANYVYTQNFNTLDTAFLTNSSNLPTGWAIKERGTGVNTVNDQYKGNLGSSNTGDVYSFGSLGTTERALGSLASGSNQSCWGAKFVNNSANDTITRLIVSFRMEQWRGGGARTVPDSTNFYYSTTINNIDTFNAGTTGWIPFSKLSLHSLVNPSGTGNSLDGNASPNNSIKTDSFNVTILPGAYIVLKWADSNYINNDDGLAIDDLSITFRGVGPTSVVNPLNTVMPLTVLGAAQTNNISLSYSIVESGNYNLTVCDITGRVVYTSVVAAKSGMNRTDINTNLQSGMYIIKLTNGKQTGVVKASIQ